MHCFISVFISTFIYIFINFFLSNLLDQCTYRNMTDGKRD